MAKIELDLSEETYEHYKNMAANNHTTVEQTIKIAIEQYSSTTIKKNKTLGAFASEPQLMDRVMEIVREERNKPFFTRETGIE